METIKQIIDKYNEYEKDHADPRSSAYPFMSSPLPSIMIATAYLAMVFIGPIVMKNRKPYELTSFKNFYNLFQIVFCGYFIVSMYVLTEIEPDGHWMLCKRWDSSDTEKTRKLLFLIYLNYLSRLIELSETAVHILRKKNRLVSVLHVYHHSANVCFSYMATKLQPGGAASIICLLNFGVHFIMYTYYFMRSSGSPFLHKTAEIFKPYLTTLQLVQFYYMLIIVGMVLAKEAVPKCFNPNYGYLTVHVICGHLLINIVLFTHFYRINYINRPKGAKLN